jgi:hypothetical protein
MLSIQEIDKTFFVPNGDQDMVSGRKLQTTPDGVASLFLFFIYLQKIPNGISLIANPVRVVC